MDIIVVKQPDDSYKHSPFRIRFGSFKVLRAKEKNVNIIVNGQKSDITMRLSECGEAYFMTEVKKRVIEDSNLSDGYSSPIDLGNSAPSSPAAKKFSRDSKINIENIPMLITNTDINIEEKLKDITCEEETLSIKITKIDSYTKIQENESEFLKFDYENFSEFPNDSISLREIRQRKLSYDVLSRNENLNKFKMSKQEDFSIISEKKSLMNIELSNCWSNVSKGKDDTEDLFSKNKVSKETFFKDPWKVLNNNNLAIKHGDYLYTWKVIAPIILSQLAFNEELPQDVMNVLTQQQHGFLWKTVNLEAFKIDLKKIKLKNESNIKNEKISAAVNLANDISKSTAVKEVTQKVEMAKRQSLSCKKSYTLSSDQIKSLKLNPGRNEISFVVSSRYQGTQVLTTEIYLWDSEDKIFISDLDGTITRSDVLGHIFPLFGKDWSHKGVVKLYNDVVKNGYKVIYLTARAICQSDQTKNYLKNSLVQSKIPIKFF